MRKLKIVSPLYTKLPSLEKSRHFIGISIVKQKVKFIDLIERPDVSRKFRKAIRKTPPRLFCEAGLFICCNGNKNNCKVSCLEMPLF